MPTSKAPRRGSEERPKSKKSVSFHGWIPVASTVTSSGSVLRRPKTQQDLQPNRKLGPDVGFQLENMTQRLPKLLLNVTVQRSLGPVQVIISPEATVEDLLGAAIRLYVKEGRRPFLGQTDPADFQLHYSQFSLDSLDPKQKLIGLGSRNFFLCPNPISVSNCSDQAAKHVAVAPCSSVAEKPAKISFPLLKILGFMEVLM